MTKKRFRKQIVFFLLSLAIVTLAVILLSIIQKNDKQLDDPNFQKQTLTWKKENGSIMELTVSVPKSWKCDSPNRLLSSNQFSGEIIFDNERGEKIAGSFGIIDTLQERQTLLDLENPHNFLTKTIDSQAITINEKKYRLDITNIGDKLRPNIFVYAYCFALENQVISFYFYNDNDNPDLLPLYEKILDSIEVTIR